MVQLTSSPHAKRPNVAASPRYTTLLQRYPAPLVIRRLSYLPEETICSPRNVVNETVKARETPANWNTRFFHGVSRNRGEKRGARGAAFSADVLRSTHPLPGALSPHTPSLSSLPLSRYVPCGVRRPTSHPLSHKPETLQLFNLLVISLHFIRYRSIPPSHLPASRVIVPVSAALPVRCFKQTRRGGSGR